MYTYQCDLLTWAGTGPYATIGYNLQGTFLNHILSGTDQVNTIACLSNGDSDNVSRREASKWHNQIYQLQANVDQTQLNISECFLQQVMDIELVGDVSQLSSSLLACPSSMLQAQIDFRFTVYDPSTTTTEMCYIHVFPTGITDTSSLFCCYSRL